MRLLIVQHVPFEGPARIIEWAAQRDHSILRHHSYLTSDFPELDRFDALVLMGGPMSANDPLPWLGKELDFLHTAIQANKKIVGICLGAQLIAKALGATVYPHSEKEIGWHTVSRAPEASRDLQLIEALPEKLLPLHWHGETFDLPDTATLLYSSESCENQAFSYGRRILGLQFHLELTHESAIRIGEECAGELVAGGRYVQTLDEILSDEENFSRAHNFLYTLLDAFLA